MRIMDPSFTHHEQNSWMEMRSAGRNDGHRFFERRILARTAPESKLLQLRRIATNGSACLVADCTGAGVLQTIMNHINVL
jgi:hypothetical protein